MKISYYLFVICIGFLFRGAVCAQCPIQEIDISGLDFPASNITCYGDNNVQLTVDFVGTCPGATYSWSNGLPPTMTVPLPQLFATTTYTVTVNDGNGNTTVGSVTVNVNNQLAVGVSANPMTICSGQSTTLLAQAAGGNGSYSYSWNQGLGSGASKIVNPIITTTYFVTVTDGVGCTATNSIQVIVNQSPVATINASATTICQGQSVTLTGSGGANCQWNTVPPQSNCIISVTPASTTQYMLTVTNANGCSATSSIQIMVLPPPTANAGADVIICSGDAASLTAQGGANYFWSTGQTTSTISVTPSANTCYYVTATVGNCSDADTVCVQVKPRPNADAGPDVEICPGENVLLEASGGTSYAWSTGEITNQIEVNPTVTTVYRVTVTNNENCFDVDDVTVLVKPGPNATLTDGGTICDGGSVTLTATGGGNYFWSTGSTSATIIVDPNITTTYSVTVTGPQECDAILETSVVVVPDPEVVVGGAGVECTGGARTLTALVTGGTGNVTYQWERSFDLIAWNPISGANTTILNLNNLTQTAHYRIRVNYGGSGCAEAISTAATVSVVSEPSPVILSIPKTYCMNGQALFYVERPSSLESQFKWEFQPSSLVEAIDTSGSPILLHFVSPGELVLTVTESIMDETSSCFGETSINISIDGGNSAPDTSSILYTPINNILIYNDSTVSCYQWGVIKENGEPQNLAGEIYQAYVAGPNYSPVIQYFVQVWNGDCSNPDCSTIKLVPRSPVIIEEPEFSSGLYPNPNFGEFTYDIHPVVNQRYLLQIADPLGVIVEEREINTTDNHIHEAFSLRTKRDGVYYLSLWSADNVYQVKPFLKVRE